MKTNENIPFAVAAIEKYHNCPVHDGGVYSGMIKFNDINDIKDYVLVNLNYTHVIDIMVFSDDSLSVNYEKGGHSFTGASIIINNKTVCRTIDNGAGKIIWENQKCCADLYL